ncbi:hypothetical protein PRK78_005311 [Emydomyces testavorans]|uniref:ESDC n=1 Tax=Emydomyces testavorans TaxID=2070801 RepID=A0AAF0IJE1_9EURO|nr:hypothetical protein PRK78_005311 [Emydomyces testavorans]
MAALQLNFSLTTPPKVKTVHLLGSWDNYHGQLPLSKTSSGKSASWAGKFRFQQSMLKPGQRYWYYYILDGYHVYHDKTCESTVERTTKRTLNILDVPRNMSGQKSSAPPKGAGHEIPTGRALSPSRIQHPKPSKPYESQRFCEKAFVTQRTMDALNARFKAADLSDSDSDISTSPPSSFGSSISSRGVAPRAAVNGTESQPLENAFGSIAEASGAEVLLQTYHPIRTSTRAAPILTRTINKRELISVTRISESGAEWLIPLGCVLRNGSLAKDSRHIRSAPIF